MGDAAKFLNNLVGRSSQLGIANRMHQKWMLERMRDLIMPGKFKGTPGLLKEEDSRSVRNVMQKEGLLPSLPDFTSFTGSGDARKK